MELRNGLRELTAFAEHQSRLAIGDWRFGPSKVQDKQTRLWAKQDLSPDKLTPFPESTNWPFSPCPSFPCFWEFLPCFLCEEFLVCLSVFPFFSRDLGVRCYRIGSFKKILVFSLVFLVLFPNKARKGRTGLFSYTVSSPFVPFVPGTGGVRRWDDCPARGIRKTFMSRQQLKKGVFGKGSFRNLCAELCFVCFLCSEVIFSCKSHRNVFQKLPLQCRHFLEKNPREKPQNAAAECVLCALFHSLHKKGKSAKRSGNLKSSAPSSAHPFP